MYSDIHFDIKGMTSVVINESVNNAVEAIKSVRQMIRSAMIFPNMSPLDMNVIKDQWIDIPEPYGHGVKVMGLHLEKDYYSLLCKYEKNAEIAGHIHEEEAELIYVLEGVIENKRNSKLYYKGDSVVIRKGESHHIATGGIEAYLYVVFSSEDKHLYIHNNDRKRFNTALKDEQVS